MDDLVDGVERLIMYDHQKSISMVLWAFQRVRGIKKKGRGGVKRAFHEMWAVGLNRVLTIPGKDHSDNIYELDWDACLILGACRYDLTQEVLVLRIP